MISKICPPPPRAGDVRASGIEGAFFAGFFKIRGSLLLWTTALKPIKNFWM